MDGGLPVELNQLCFEIFLRCDYFEDFKRFRSFCRGIDGLYHLTISLKESGSTKEIVENNLPILINHRHDTYGWALLILVDALRHRYKTTEELIWKDLDNLYSQVYEFERKITQACKNITTNKNENLLFKSILTIDFEEQEQEFVEALDYDHHKVAAFLIHGQEKYGQEILVTRLAQLRQLCNGRKIKIKVGGMGDISDLWHEVAKHFFNTEQPAYISETVIIDKIVEALQTQHIIFIFDEVHRTCIGFLPQLIADFWQPIIEKTHEQTQYLVMFWIDHKAKICDSEIPLVYHHSEVEYPNIPLCLTQVNRFSYKKLSQWLRQTDIEIIPKGLSIENLLKESKSGVPELVYQKICVHCGSNWEGRIAQWLIQ